MNIPPKVAEFAAKVRDAADSLLCAPVVFTVGEGPGYDRLEGPPILVWCGVHGVQHKPDDECPECQRARIEVERRFGCSPWHGLDQLDRVLEDLRRRGISSRVIPCHPRLFAHLLTLVNPDCDLRGYRAAAQGRRSSGGLWRFDYLFVQDPCGFWNVAEIGRWER